MKEQLRAPDEPFINKVKSKTQISVHYLNKSKEDLYHWRKDNLARYLEEDKLDFLVKVKVLNLLLSKVNQEGITLNMLVEDIDVGYSNLITIMRNPARVFTVKLLKKLADYFNVSMDYFVQELDK